MNLPNKLTVSRIFLTFLFIILLNIKGFIPQLLATLVFILASFTDYFDGYLAKKYNLTSDFGKLMDPVADKFLILAAFFIFMKMDTITAWMFYAILTREVVVTLFRCMAIKKGVILSAEVFGKLKMISQIVAVSVILVLVLFQESKMHDTYAVRILENTIPGIMVIVVFLTVFSGASYLWSNRHILYAS